MRGGDHLRGQWRQNCAPDAIKRPDRYAYGMALPSARGQWDYRLCYQMSYLERERVREALSWTWQPDACEMSKVDGGRFSRWLGERTLLFWGDSLTAQHFFSLVFLLGDAVVALRDGDGVTSSSGGEEGKRSRCDYRGLGGEGGRYREARLRDGGKILKVLGHAEMRDELLNGFEKAWWRPLWEGADLIVFNLIGHHLRTLPKAFGRGYRSMASSALDVMVRHTKPSAMLIMRTSNVGHLQCQESFAPLTKRSVAWEQLGGWGWRPAKTTAAYYGAPREGTTADKYDWRAPPLHEHVWAKLASTNPALGPKRFRILNVSHVDLRADGHVASAMKQSADTTKNSMGVDCLHYCIPGPSDAWASALYHQLLFTT